MWLTAFILNLLVIVMVLAPCRDHGGQADDDCSPLCTCSCCASVSPSIDTPVVEDVALDPVVKKFPVYITRDHQADRSAVWQPPRIG